jgi:predicted RNase H-like HicB family nuclease
MREDSYTVTIFWSGEDQTFIAVADELPGCSAFGDTREEALQEIKTAIRLWLDVAREHGDPIPSPTPRNQVADMQSMANG